MKTGGTWSRTSIKGGEPSFPESYSPTAPVSAGTWTTVLAGEPVISLPAATPMPGPYDALQNLQFIYIPEQWHEGESGSYKIADAGYFIPALETDPALIPFNTKYLNSRIIDASTVVLHLQRPGMHKYDTMDVTFRLTPTGTGAEFRGSMIGEPVFTRETSSLDSYRDDLETAAVAVAVAATMYAGATYAAGASSAAAAETTATATTASSVSGATAISAEPLVAMGQMELAGSVTAAIPEVGTAAVSNAAIVGTVVETASTVSSVESMYSEFFDPHNFADANPIGVASDAETVGYGFVDAGAGYGAPNTGAEFAATYGETGDLGYGSPAPAIEPVGDFGVQQYPFGPSPEFEESLRNLAGPSNPAATPGPSVSDYLRQVGNAARGVSTATRDVVSGLGILYGATSGANNSTANQRLPVTSPTAHGGQLGAIPNSAQSASGGMQVSPMLLIGAVVAIGAFLILKK